MKMLATGHKDRLKIPSGPKMTPQRMVKEVKEATANWKYEAVSIGYPSFVFGGHPLAGNVVEIIDQLRKANVVGINVLEFSSFTMFGDALLT